MTNNRNHLKKVERRGFFKAILEIGLFLKSILIQFHYFFFLQKCMHIELNLISWKYSNTLENLETHMNKLLKVHLLKIDLKSSINASSLSCINNQRI